MPIRAEVTSSWAGSAGSGSLDGFALLHVCCGPCGLWEVSSGAAHSKNSRASRSEKLDYQQPRDVFVGTFASCRSRLW